MGTWLFHSSKINSDNILFCVCAWFAQVSYKFFGSKENL